MGRLSATAEVKEGPTRALPLSSAISSRLGTSAASPRNLAERTRAGRTASALSPGGIFRLPGAEDQKRNRIPVEKVGDFDHLSRPGAPVKSGSESSDIFSSPNQ